MFQLLVQYMFVARFANIFIIFFFFLFFILLKMYAAAHVTRANKITAFQIGTGHLEIALRINSC